MSSILILSKGFFLDFNLKLLIIFSLMYLILIGLNLFRNGLDISTEQLKNWPNELKVSYLKDDCIYYTSVNSICNCKDIKSLPCCNAGYLNALAANIKNKNEYGLPKTQIPPNQVTIAGGFFLTNGKNIKWWHDKFYFKLDLYFKHNYLVKDDQIIIIDCIVNHFDKFNFVQQPRFGFDRWFAFANYLL